MFVAIAYTSVLLPSTDVDDIVCTSMAANIKNDIGSLFYVSQASGYVFQIIEGEKIKVHDLMRRIFSDARHRAVQIRYSRSLASRIIEDVGIVFIKGNYTTVEQMLKAILGEKYRLRVNPHVIIEESGAQEEGADDPPTKNPPCCACIRR